MTHAAAIELVCCGILADGQSVYNLPLEIILVLSQYHFQSIVQKPQDLFQLGKIVSGDGDEPLFSRRGDICSGRSCNSRRVLWHIRGRLWLADIHGSHILRLTAAFDFYASASGISRLPVFR